MERVEPAAATVRLCWPEGGDSFDAVVVTAFAPDLARLLDDSGLTHRIPQLRHTHVKCVTIDLDPRETAAAGDHVAFYAHAGYNVVVQPRHRRCVVLCARCVSTRTDDVAAAAAKILSLKFRPVAVRARNNQLPGEAIYTADFLNPERILSRPAAAVYFAGSYFTNSYPLDSGEAAVRSARTAVERLACDHYLRLRTGTP